MTMLETQIMTRVKTYMRAEKLSKDFICTDLVPYTF